MELKVRVDGVTRVVCGVSENTTCQEVVIALAQAMGRTGRFTLIEKWRDSERPLLPSDCPVKVLQKWGEYASEVQMLLHQTDKKAIVQTNDIPKQVRDQENVAPSVRPSIKEKEVGLRRVLTFSGPHNTQSVPFSRQSGSARTRGRLTNDRKAFESITESELPVNKSQKNEKGDVSATGPVNGMREHPDFHPAYRRDIGKTAYQGLREERLEPTQPAYRVNAKEAKHVRLGNDVMYHQPRNQTHDYQNTGSDGVAPINRPQTGHSNDHNHRLRGDYTGKDWYDYTQANNEVSSSHHGGRQHLSKPGSDVRNQRNPGYIQYDNGRREIFSEHSPNHLSSHQTFENSALRRSPFQTKSPVVNQEFVLNDSAPNNTSFVQNRGKGSAFQPVVSNSPKLNSDLVNGDIDVPLYSGVPIATADVEEYDLESNLPGVGHTSAKQLLIEEYRMPGDGRHREQDLSPVDSALTEDPEVVRMKKLVTLQQDRIKAQDVHINSIESDIKSLEVEDREQTELLTKISDEIIDLNKTNHKYEIEIKELDSTKWVDAIEDEKNRDKEIRLCIEDIRRKLTQHSDEISTVNKKAEDLEKEILAEKSEYETEVKKKEEEDGILEKELKTVSEELDKENEKIDNDKTILDDIEKELQELALKLDQQKGEMEELEKELKEANIEEFNLSPKETRKVKKPDTGEAVLKMLEGRMSPAIGLNRKNVISPLSKVLSASKNPNGVWV
ncbi:hypothetical protein FSP39_010566 [Pinctada imbricata]|uniref:Ras-associating domain-containing protein n=1 Tax=Pinctada imbricata TaxID=66713 RepID=A0AA89CAF0_PINIB|nr:hypothetical protein FSP39_010566 [Pinctada imbricata]